MDREKVIKGLGCCEKDEDLFICGECPYIEDHKFGFDCVRKMCRDALAMLKDYDTQLQYRDDHIAEYEKEIKRLEDLLHKKEKDIDKLCVEINRLKHQIHDNEPTFEDWTKGEGR